MSEGCSHKGKLVSVGWKPPDKFVNLVSRSNINRRINRIGSVNKQILLCILNGSRDNCVKESQLESHNFFCNDNNVEYFQHITPEEIFYRITFLIAVGLVRLKYNKEGESVFYLSENVAIDLLQK